MPTPPHKNAHYPIPTQEGLSQIIDLMMENKNNPTQLAKLEQEIPPHIMKALVEFSERRADEAEQRAERAEQEFQQAKKETHEANIKRLKAEQLEAQIKCFCKPQNSNKKL